MTTMIRTDLNVIGDLLDKLTDDFAVAQETSSLREWAEAVEAVAEYMAERHKEIHTSE